MAKGSKTISTRKGAPANKKAPPSKSSQKRLILPNSSNFESHLVAPEAMQNSFGGGGFPAMNWVNGFPGGYGNNPWAPQIEQVNTLFYNMRWYLISNMRQPLSQAYAEIALIRCLIDVPVDDGLRGGVEIKSKQLDEGQIEELQISMDRDDDINIAGQAEKWNGLYGGAGVIILAGDQDPEEPLDVGAINKNTSLEYRAVDMWELFWDQQNTDGYDAQIQEEEFDHYSYYDIKLHKSRVMRMKGLVAPSFIRPRLRGWGISKVELLIRSINQYLKATDVAFEVLDEFKVDVYKLKNLVNTLMSPQGEQSIMKRMQTQNWAKNYQNALIMDSEDDWDHKQLSFAGLAETMEQIRMQVASDMRMPITKLFGTSTSKGLGNGDQNDMENYNSMVESDVRAKVKYHILRMIELKCQKLFGMIPSDLQISFKPLRVLTAEQEENVKTQIFTRVLQARQAGELSSLEFRDSCNKADIFPIKLDTAEDMLNPDDPEVDDIVKEGGQDPEDPKDEKDPGTAREDSRKPTGQTTKEQRGSK